MILCAETEGKLRGERSAHVGDVAVWIVGVLRGDAPRLRDVQYNVAVVVVTRNVEHAVHRHGQKPLYSAHALFRAGLVRAPEILERAGRAVGELDLFKDDVVAVPDECVCLYRSPCRAVVHLYDLLYAAVVVVVAVHYGARTGNWRDWISRKHTVLRIIRVGERTVILQVAVGIIDEVYAGGNGGVLIQVVC